MFYTYEWRMQKNCMLLKEHATSNQMSGGHPWLNVLHNIRASLRECRLFFFQFRWWHSELKRKRKTYRRYAARKGQTTRGEKAVEEMVHRVLTGHRASSGELRRPHSPTRNSNFVATVINAWNFLYVSAVDRHHTKQYLSVKICEHIQLAFCLLRIFIL
jgi:hypothetical protein